MRVLEELEELAPAVLGAAGAVELLPWDRAHLGTGDRWQESGDKCQVVGGMRPVAGGRWQETGGRRQVAGYRWLDRW